MSEGRHFLTKKRAKKIEYPLRGASTHEAKKEFRQRFREHQERHRNPQAKTAWRHNL